MTYTAKEWAFIRFLSGCIKKNKRYQFCDLTNQELSERFIYQGKTYSKRTIEELFNKVKNEFEIKGFTKRRLILLKDSTSITTPLTHDSHTIQPVLPHDSHTITTFPEQESLEPVSIQEPPLSIKNKELINNIKTKPPIIPHEVNTPEERVKTVLTSRGYEGEQFACLLASFLVVLATREVKHIESYMSKWLESQDKPLKVQDDERRRREEEWDRAYEEDKARFLLMRQLEGVHNAAA